MEAEDEHGPLAGREALDGPPEDHGLLVPGGRDRLDPGPGQEPGLDAGPA
jgi:hypothetical protein